jgi:hypothetical protein
MSLSQQQGLYGVDKTNVRTRIEHTNFEHELHELWIEINTSSPFVLNLEEKKLIYH